MTEYKGIFGNLLSQKLAVKRFSEVDIVRKELILPGGEHARTLAS